MPRVCHVLDASAGWEQRLALGILRDRLDPSRFPQRAASLGPTAIPETARLYPLGPTASLSAPALRRFFEREPVEVVQTWSVPSAAAARAASDRPLAVELFDPTAVREDLKQIRTLDERGSVAWVCASGVVRRRLIEGGVAPDRCVLIRPAVDFSRVNRVRRSPLRETLGFPREQTLILTPEPVTRESWAFEAFAAASLANHLRGETCLIVPGISAEADRIARYASTLPSRPTLLRTYDQYRFEELVCVADVLLVPATGNLSTTSIAWAMAGGAVVISAAVPAIAELVAHKVNGLLFNPKAGCGPIVSIAKLLNQTDDFPRLREAARGQAYEVFGIRRNVEQHARVYENLLSGAAAGEGVVDSAHVA